MAVTGAHVLLYSSEPEELRNVFKEVLGWDHVDAGEGWLIFALPPAEVAVHPAEAPSHELSLTCDDIATTVAELQAAGVDVPEEPTDRGWGIAVTVTLPGGVDVLLYEPRHPTAI